MNVEKIGNRIKSRREELDLTLDDVANAVGVAKSTIQRYENGVIERLKIPVLQSISNVLGVNPDWLLCISDQKKSEDSWDWDSSYLKECRENCNYSHEEMAEKLGISTSRYTAIEDGTIRPTVPLLCSMAVLLHTTVDLLLKLQVPITTNKKDISDEEHLLHIFRSVNQKGKEQIIQQAEYALRDPNCILPIPPAASDKSAG